MLGSEIGREAVDRVRVELADQRGDECDQVKVIIDVDDRVVRVDVAGGDPEDDAGYATVGLVEGSGISATAAADGNLMGNAFGARGVDGKTGEARIGDRGRIVEANLNAAAEPPLAIGAVESWSVVGGRTFEDDGHIGLGKDRGGFAPRRPTSSCTVPQSTRWLG